MPASQVRWPPPSDDSDEKYRSHCFDPTIEQRTEMSYMNYLFQLPSLLLSGDFVSKLIFVIVITELFFGLRPLFVPTTLAGLILSGWFIFSVAAVVFQNAVFPVIPRLLDPVPPLAALDGLMLVSMGLKRLKESYSDCF
jgi:hypothetical protein